MISEGRNCVAIDPLSQNGSVTQYTANMSGEPNGRGEMNMRLMLRLVTAGNKVPSVAEAGGGVRRGKRRRDGSELIATGSRSENKE